ncbi:helix-turn-helix domain-containing protein [Nocardioides sp. NPDC058538]|uniref:helix-turn-helix domain-containing protein n=1 Tax=Nocardioides sp. NPDC058538 TaxID=3346542 RepID=UPI003650835E
MTAEPLDQQTYTATPTDRLADVLDFIQAYESRRSTGTGDQHLSLGSDDESHIELPEPVYRALAQIVEALAAGKAVTVAPQNQLLTTQQAADLLGVSRPTVVKLIDDGSLPASTPGTKRRMIRLDDLIAYRAGRREAQLQAIFETSAGDPSLDDDPESIAEQLRFARAEVGARRRARTEG